jgi:hypothetical protein
LLQPDGDTAESRDRQIERHAHAADAAANHDALPEQIDYSPAFIGRFIGRFKTLQAKRRGRAAPRGSTRQLSCRLPFDAPKNSAPAGLLPPGCRDIARRPSHSA